MVFIVYIVVNDYRYYYIKLKIFLRVILIPLDEKA